MIVLYVIVQISRGANPPRVWLWLSIPPQKTAWGMEIPLDIPMKIVLGLLQWEMQAHTQQLEKGVLL